jgi:hypothetical protein
MRHSRVGTLCCCALIFGTFAFAAGAQRKAPGDRGDTKVAVTIALDLGGQSYGFSGPAACTYAPKASIYDMAAEQWAVQQSDGARSLALTVWQPAGGGRSMFSLATSNGGKSSTVDTVIVKGRGTAQGSGTVTLEKAGAGGVFTLAATSANGVRINGTIKCAAFSPAIAEGGH